MNTPIENPLIPVPLPFPSPPPPSNTSGQSASARERIAGLRRDRLVQLTRLAPIKRLAQYCCVRLSTRTTPRSLGAWMN